MKNLLTSILFGLLLTNCQTQNLSLTNVEWKLIMLNGTDYSTLTKPVTLTLSPDSNAAGHAGCNRYFSSYTQSGSALSFGNMGATKMYCIETMKVEDAFLKALGEVDGYLLTGNKLQLLQGETVLLEFTQ
ncbi:MAG: META domain-containing protein [Cyclobacteriaceae bacterium]|nr:META domain-containing protein [Cyclobacteriaceae bacterium]